MVTSSLHKPLSRLIGTKTRDLREPSRRPLGDRLLALHGPEWLRVGEDLPQQLARAGIGEVFFIEQQLSIGRIERRKAPLAFVLSSEAIFFPDIGKAGLAARFGE
jgi:hypothetical protein